MGRIHARCLSRQVEGGHLIAVADLDREKATRCAEEFGATGVHGDDVSLLADRSIDAALICTPGNTHADLIEAAAEAGKHVFCEKPIDWDLSAADRALTAVERAGVKLQIGFNRRFDPAFLDAREAISRVRSAVRTSCISSAVIRRGRTGARRRRAICTSTAPSTTWTWCGI